MNNEPKCPKCQYEYTYQDRDQWVCPECSHQWSTTLEAQAEKQEIQNVVKDANGNVLVTGDNVTVVKDLKVKGASSSLKGGTKIKNIRVLEDAEDGHNVACRVDGFGSLNLKSEFLKKS